ncbi:MAG: ACP S-malonyltransferase, partial [Chitinophagales bacterium]|nr:ACP S-malonyltransferase [Chitinophagales bacterium]
NATASAVLDPELIQKNLIAQLTAPVFWWQSVDAMINEGATTFIECGPGNVLQGLVKKINKNVITTAL